MKNYKKPNVQIKKFISEDVITTSGVASNNPLTALTSKAFSVSESNVSWNDKVGK